MAKTKKQLKEEILELNKLMVRLQKRQNKMLENRLDEFTSKQLKEIIQELDIDVWHYND